MCGIAGILGPSGGDRELLQRMGGTLAHRGPDDDQVWNDGEAGIGLVFRRLAIVDLSENGRQPMRSADGRWTICFNGEFYNHRSIRAELVAAGKVPEGGWRGHSDTETFLEAVAHWGPHRALAEAVGMFAIALWDHQERELFLVRDRFGEKPLYFGHCGKDFVFGSELKAIRQHADFDGEIDREALTTYAALGYIAAPRTIYRSIAKLEPGQMLRIKRDREPRLEQYWSHRDLVDAGFMRPIDDVDEAIEAIDDALRTALSDQAVADVPVGAFLSGGIDSSTIVALYQSVSGQPVHTYSIGFDEAGYDEAKDAARIATHLGTRHHEHYVGVDAARDVIPDLPRIYDEPFADSSQIPTFLVSKFARSEVTVAITGDGGDEMFAGYNRHRVLTMLWSKVGRLPPPFRKAASGLANAIPKSLWSDLARWAGESRAELGAKAARATDIVANARNIEAAYAAMLDEWHGEGSPILGANKASIPVPDLPDAYPDITKLTHADTVGYLPGDILTKVDRASMAVSLETRVPFLDHRVAAVAARVDPKLKVRDGKGKWILRQLLHRHVPRPMLDRPKAGFAVPVGDWIRGSLRDWAESLIDEKRLRDEGYFDPAMVRARWDKHLAGEDQTPAIWAILMFQAWLDEQR